MERPVLLVGTAHVVDLAQPLRRLLTGRELQGIAVELDAERAAALLSDDPQGAGRRGGGGPFFVRLWGALQRRLGEELGAGAGAEMRAAALLAREWQLPLFLIDDPIRETIGRLLRSMSVRERLSLLVGSVIGFFLPSGVVQAQIGAYQEAPADLLEEMRAQFPGVSRVLLDERNEHMASRLAELRSKGYGRIAAVVGDAHLPGLADALGRRGIPAERVPLAQLRALGTTAPSAAAAPRT
jgi:pheromone shutdown protein TraB